MGICSNVLSGSQLSIWRLDAGSARLRQQVALAAAGPLSLFILPAEGALLVRNGVGHLSLWFDVAGDTGHDIPGPGIARSKFAAVSARR